MADYEAWAERAFTPAPEILGEWRGMIDTGRIKIRSFSPSSPTATFT
jgi:hypothetical protein